MTPDEKKQALRVELLVDPLVLAPGPELAPIKPYYVTVIETAISDWNTAHPGGPVAAYGPYTDQAIERDLAVMEQGFRAVEAVAKEIRNPLMRGSWGAIQLLAAQTPPYDPLAPASRNTSEVQTNILARNIVSLLMDPAEVWEEADYDRLAVTCGSLLTQGIITQQEHDDVLGVMMGRQMTRSYAKFLVARHTEFVTWAEVSLALRGP